MLGQKFVSGARKCSPGEWEKILVELSERSHIFYHQFNIDFLHGDIFLYFATTERAVATSLFFGCTWSLRWIFQLKPTPREWGAVDKKRNISVLLVGETASIWSMIVWEKHVSPGDFDARSCKKARPRGT